MKRWGLLVAGLLLAGPAHAQSWRAKPVLMADRSPNSCVLMNLDRVFYDLTVEGTTIRGSSTTGVKFSGPVAPNGTVKLSFTNASGNPIELSGNATTRDLELHTPRNSCRSKLVPAP